VLVGGFGTRLRPLTDTTPKQMLPIVHRPMIEWVLEHLADHGVDDAVLSLGYRADAFQNRYPDGYCAGIRLHYAVEPEPLDTAGAIRFAALHAGLADRFLVVNSDVITTLDVSSLVAFHDENGGEATISLHQVEDPSRYGVVPTSPDGRVEAFVEKPPRDEAPTDRINAGMYVFEPAVLDRIAADRRVSVERETFPAMVDDGTLYALDDGGTYWIDAGTPATYLEAQLDLLDGRLGTALDGISPDARIARGASVLRSVVAAGATVAGDASVRDSALLDGVAVGPGAIVTDSVIGPGGCVGAGAMVVGGTVIGAGVQVDAGARLAGQRVPEPA
jgi:mannose-1-phosphate guanylyltransferase